MRDGLAQALDGLRAQAGSCLGRRPKPVAVSEEQARPPAALPARLLTGRPPGPYFVLLYNGRPIPPPEAGRREQRGGGAQRGGQPARLPTPPHGAALHIVVALHMPSATICRRWQRAACSNLGSHEPLSHARWRCRLYKANRLRDAMYHYEKAIALNPTSAVYRCNRAAVLLTEDKVEACVAELLRAVTLAKPDYWRPRERLAEIATRPEVLAPVLIASGGSGRSRVVSVRPAPSQRRRRQLRSCPGHAGSQVMRKGLVRLRVPLLSTALRGSAARPTQSPCRAGCRPPRHT